MSRIRTASSRAFRVAALGLSLLALPLLAQAPVYHAEYLGNATHVAAMNDAGLVVGTGAIFQYPRAYVAGPGMPLTYLKLPLGFLSSGARDINDAGVIVGVMSPYQTTAFYPQPVRWDPDGKGGYTPTLLATLPGDNRGTADAINNLGDILGTSAYQSSMHVVQYSSGNAVNLPTLAGLLPQSINDLRQYVGAGSWRVDLDTMIVESLGVPAGFGAAHGWVINASGQVAGDVTGGAGCAQENALYTDGLGWQTLGPCGTDNSAYDLDDQGDVLMTLDSVPYVHFVDGGLWRVEDLIVAASGHWTVNPPFNMALNNARQMAVYASNGGQSGIILISPEGGVTCQENLGFAGPGQLQLSVCGGDLSTGTTADLQLSGALPGVAAWLVTGLSSQPAPFKGGTLVPLPILLEMPLAVDGLGLALIPGIPGGLGPATLYLQMVQANASQPQGWAISNALRVDFLP
jgi:hypothetical protein